MINLNEKKISIASILWTFLVFVLFNLISLAIQFWIIGGKGSIPLDAYYIGLPFAWLQIIRDTAVPSIGWRTTLTRELGLSISTIVLMLDFVAYYFLVLSTRWIIKKVRKKTPSVQY